MTEPHRTGMCCRKTANPVLTCLTRLRSRAFLRATDAGGSGPKLFFVPIRVPTTDTAGLGCCWMASRTGKFCCCCGRRRLKLLRTVDRCNGESVDLRASIDVAAPLLLFSSRLPWLKEGWSTFSLTADWLMTMRSTYDNKCFQFGDWEKRRNRRWRRARARPIPMRSDDVLPCCAAKQNGRRRMEKPLATQPSTPLDPVYLKPPSSTNSKKRGVKGASIGVAIVTPLFLPSLMCVCVCVCVCMRETFRHHSILEVGEVFFLWSEQNYSGIGFSIARGVLSIPRAP